MPKQPKEVPDPAGPDEDTDTQPTDNAPDALDPPEVPPNAMHDPSHPLHHLRNT